MKLFISGIALLCSFIGHSQSMWSQSDNGIASHHWTLDMTVQDDGDIILSANWYTMFMYYQRELYKSSDNGITWSPIVYSGLPDIINSPAIISLDSTLLIGHQYDNSQGIVSRSDDDGLTWTSSSAGIAYDLPDDLYSVDFAKNDQGTVYILFRNQGINTGPLIAKSTDRGLNWTVLTTSGLDDTSELYSIEAIGTTLLLSAKRQSNSTHIIYKSTDEGANWNESTFGFNIAHQPSDFTVNDSGVIYLAAKHSTGQAQMLYKSWDQGAIWVYQPTYGFSPNLRPYVIQHIDNGYLMGGKYGLLNDPSGIVYRSEPNVSLSSASLSSISVSPNPASESLSISGDQIQRIEIVDMNGSVKLVDDSNLHSIDISSFENGVYFIQVTSLSETTSLRFIKH